MYFQNQIAYLTYTLGFRSQNPADALIILLAGRSQYVKQIATLQGSNQKSFRYICLPIQLSSSTVIEDFLKKDHHSTLSTLVLRMLI